MISLLFIRSSFEYVGYVHPSPVGSVALDQQVVVCGSGGTLIYSAPHAILFVVLLFVVPCLFDVDLIVHRVPPKGHGVFSCGLSLFVSEGDVGHFPSVPLCTRLPLLIFCGVSEFLSWSFQFKAVLPPFFDGHV